MLTRILALFLVIFLSGCNGSARTQTGSSGVQFSSGMAQAEIEEEGAQGEMRNIR